MIESFVIPVNYQNKALEFPAQLFTTTYSYSIEVIIDDEKINFEKDDEGAFRAIASSPHSGREQKIKPDLLQAVAYALEEILA